MQSKNYVAGATGWKLHKCGQLEVKGVVRVDGLTDADETALHPSEIKARKKALEVELAKTIQQAFSQFKAETGVSILAIDVNVFRAHCFDESEPDPVVGTVALVLDL